MSMKLVCLGVSLTIMISCSPEAHVPPLFPLQQQSYWYVLSVVLLPPPPFSSPSVAETYPPTLEIVLGSYVIRLEIILGSHVKSLNICNVLFIY